ncbi:MAG: TetR/AcrR family bet gene transcriptional repressor, partial [Gammaproteobacteria bacterium]
MPKIGMEPVRRAQLIDATCESIFQYGMADTTINKISGLAGVSTGIISHYFGGKNELIEATMRKILIDLADAVATRVRKAATPRQKILAIIEGNFSHHQTSARFVTSWLAFWSQSVHVPSLARLQNINKRRLRSNLVYWYRRLLSSDDATMAAEGMAALIDGLWLRGALEQNGFDSQQ